MRRSLLSGQISAQEVSQKLSTVPLVEISAADHLIGLIESTEEALTKHLLVVGGDANISTLYARSTAGLTRKRDAQAARKAVRSAIGFKADDDVEEMNGVPKRKRAKIGKI